MKAPREHVSDERFVDRFRHPCALRARFVRRAIKCPIIAIASFDTCLLATIDLR
jgi:hypothetical protein